MQLSKFMLILFFGFQLGLVVAVFLVAGTSAAVEWALTRVAPYAAIAWLSWDAAQERPQ